MKLKNKTALVSGATRKIGRTIARTLAAEGARLILPYHDDWPDDCKSLLDEFSGTESGHLLIKADLRDSRDTANVADMLREECGSLHILVNNIERGGMPIVHGSYAREINRSQWELEFDTTLLAKRLVFEACLPLLKQADQASVVNISSIAAMTGRTGPAAFLFSDGYAAANRGISSLTETWARLGAPTVRVNEIMIGLIDTRHGKETQGWQALSAEVRKQLIDHILLGKTGSPRDVAEAVLFLTSGGGYITGTVIRIDGGYALGGEGVVPMPEGII